MKTALGGRRTGRGFVAQPRLILRLYDKITQGLKQYSLIIRRIRSSRLYLSSKKTKISCHAGWLNLIFCYFYTYLETLD